ncbi:MAG: hypothetical protein IKE65_10435 [Clostridia bacterium]|nr:hypothetical protein [Clostridia bacterium]
MKTQNELADAAINHESLIVIDFSAIVAVDSFEELNTFTEYILQHHTKVAVSREFYENYEIILKSLNNEQISIAKMTSKFLDLLNENDCLLYMADIVDSKEIVTKLHKNPKVFFVYYRNSEFAENVIGVKDTLKAKAFIVDENGKFQICMDTKSIVDLCAKHIDSSVISDDYFATAFEVKEGICVKTKEGTILTLGKPCGSGGEGTVYNCEDNPAYVVKIYHKGQLNKLRLKKLFLMEKKQVRYNGICWPEKVIFSMKGEPVGYMMKKITGKPLSSIFDGDEVILKEFPYWKKQDLISLATDILQKIQYLHLFGILVGDLRLKNIVIDAQGTPWIVDIDSCQIDALPCPIGYPDFTPPELQKKEFKQQLRSYYNESFSCSVLMFKILFCGLHPYNQKNAQGTLEENISSRSFPYPQNVQGDFSKIPWGGYDEMWRHTPFQIQVFFYDIFKTGYRYSLIEIILMLKTYYEFLDIKMETIPSLNEISFDYE